MNETNQQCLSLLSENAVPLPHTLRTSFEDQANNHKIDSIPTPRNGGTISTRTILRISLKTANGYNKNSQSSHASHLHPLLLPYS